MPSSVQRWVVEEPYLHARLGLGEGPNFHEETKTLRFVDIKGQKVHQIDLADDTSTQSTIQLDVPVSFISGISGNESSETSLVGLKHGIAVLSHKTGQYQYLAELDVPSPHRIRTNDGAVGPDGSLWFGTMTDFGYGDAAPEGALLRYRNGKLETVLEGLRVPNGIGWSPTSDTMYFVHSSAKQILAFQYGSDGNISNQSIWYQHEGPGDPDGLRVDVDGNVWVAIWGEGRVLRLSPAGTITGEVHLPTRFVTCPEFVNTELFITSAADEDGEELSSLYGGSLFRVDVGVRGLPTHMFNLA